MGETVSAAEAAGICEVWRAAGRKIVFTNGHFDVLHVGHVDVLQRARRLGDVLVVGLNSDGSTRRLKGPLRPIVPEEDRATMLAALSCVDLVVIFDEATATGLVRDLQPDVYAKGGDWDPTAGGDGPPEAAEVRRYGGAVCFLPYMLGYSTSSLIQTILDRMCDSQAEAG